MQKPHPSFVQKTRYEQTDLVKTIGTRMRLARELCNMSQSAAARRMGYSNSAKLSKVENATDTNSVPLWLIKRAASVYEVSIDYLFGDSDEWEAGTRMAQERATSAWLFQAWEKSHTRDIETLRKLHDKVEAMQSAITLMIAATGEASAALERFAELNPEYQDMRAGSRLSGAVERAFEAANYARAKLNRFRVECTMAAADSPQLSLVLCAFDSKSQKESV